jgi:hypothetical protein
MLTVLTLTVAKPLKTVEHTLTDNVLPPAAADPLARYPANCQPDAFLANRQMARMLLDYTDEFLQQQSAATVDTSGWSDDAESDLPMWEMEGLMWCDWAVPVILTKAGTRHAVVLTKMAVYVLEVQLARAQQQQQSANASSSSGSSGAAKKSSSNGITVSGSTVQQQQQQHSSSAVSNSSAGAAAAADDAVALLKQQQQQQLLQEDDADGDDDKSLLQGQTWAHMQDAPHDK